MPCGQQGRKAVCRTGRGGKTGRRRTYGHCF